MEKVMHLPSSSILTAEILKADRLRTAEVSYWKGLQQSVIGRAIIIIIISSSSSSSILIIVIIIMVTISIIIIYLYTSPSIIRIINLRRIRWVGHVARKGKKRNAYRLLGGKPEGRRPLGRPIGRWVDNIKMGRCGLDLSSSG
jgi:hypothetical protein